MTHQIFPESDANQNFKRKNSSFLKMVHKNVDSCDKAFAIIYYHNNLKFIHHNRINLCCIRVNIQSKLYLFHQIH